MYNSNGMKLDKVKHSEIQALRKSIAHSESQELYTYTYIYIYRKLCGWVIGWFNLDSVI